MAAKFTMGRKTAYDYYLKACAVCKCSLAVKVWTPIEAISAGTPDSQLKEFASFCWIPKEVAEYRKKEMK
jgi:hypothetical protein